MTWAELLDGGLQGGCGRGDGQVDPQILQVDDQSWIQEVHLQAH